MGRWRRLLRLNNRGVALWKDKVISIALDGRMFAINKATGEVVWERKIADPVNAEVPIALGPKSINHRYFNTLINAPARRGIDLR